MVGGGDTCAAPVPHPVASLAASPHPVASLAPGRYGVDECTVAAVLDARAAEFGDRSLLVIDGIAISFAQMRDRANAAANVLLELGVSSGDTVALFAGSTPQWVYFWLGAARIGALTAAVNAANKGDYLRHALAISRAKVVVTDTAERCLRVLEVAGELDLLHTVLTDELAAAGESGLIIMSTTGLLGAASTNPPAALGFSPADTAALFFTSGTTGPSKAVATSWQYLFTAAATVASAWEFAEGEVIWSAMPLFHLSAVATVLAPLLVGGTTVLAAAFRPTQVWDQLRGCNAVGFVGAGAMVSMLWSLPVTPTDRVPGLRFISAAPIPAELHRAIERRYDCRVVTMYGLTEAFPIAVKAVGEDGVPGTSGRTNDDFDVAILDADGRPVVGVVGEIACRGGSPEVMSQGYVEASAAGLLVRRHDEWFRTGDLGRLDAARNLTYVDRAKDAIRRRGENVSSVEVETVVTGYRGIAEAAAVAVPSALGEQDILVVLGVVPGTVLDPSGLLDYCAERMPYFCVPRYVRVVSALPRNVVGRVRKDLLRAEGLGTDSWDREANGYVLDR
jgi:crotonobetaine/carnitine-CoA ligase